MRYAAILNSRQGKAPAGSDPWITSTLAAVRDALNHDLTIISSVGLNTWELVTWAAGHFDGRILLYVPYPYEKNLSPAGATETLGRPALENLICREFALPAQRVEFIFQPPERRRGTKKTFWPERDRKLIEMADVLYPISIRPRGNLATLIAEVGKAKNICDKYRVVYRQQHQRHTSEPFTCSTATSTRVAAWDYLTHWTRAANGTWPGETCAEYYRDITLANDHYPRSAIDTLQRILRERLLLASPAHIRGGFPVVSFTALAPHEALQLMRWRRRYVRWSFEPYGIAIRNDAAQAAGIRPVIYGTPADYQHLAEPDRPFFQNIGMRGGDWLPEKEWRHLGDLDLAKIPDEALKIMVHTSMEIPQIRILGDRDIAAMDR
jgi:hypothetical protein